MTTVNLILLATLLLVAILGGFNWFTIWAGLPLLMAAVLTEFSLASEDGNWATMPMPRRLGLIGLIAGVVTFTLYMHVSLFFGLGLEDEEGAGKYGYMLAPLYAILGGGAGFVLGYLYGRRVSPQPPHRSGGPPEGTGPSSREG